MHSLTGLQVYRCHKQVEAAKIKAVHPIDSPACLWAARLEFEAGSNPDGIYVPQDFLDKHAPQPGGYFVIYADGYLSYSPCEAFESGYTLVS